MAHPRSLAPAMGLAAVLAAGPFLAASALAADPVVVVKAGDTLSGISKRQGVAIRDIASLNGLTDLNRIYVGQRLRIVPPVPAAPAPPAAPVPAAPPSGTVHTVARGESLWTIARHYGVSLSAIVAANGIGNPGRIYGGQRLTIPGTAPAPVPLPSAPPAAAPAAPAPPAAPVPAAPPSGTVHTVARGESLWTIARHYGVSLSAIVAANGIGNPGRIYGGQRLTIPGTAPAPLPSAPPAAAPASPTTMPASMARLVAERDAMRRLIVGEAQRFGVPTALALAVAWQESGWRQNVVSSAGAVGIMQLMPATATWVGEAMLGTPVDMNDATQNVRAGVRLLAHYLARYRGDRDLVLAAYYQGQTAADRHGVYAVSRPYIASIRLLEVLFGG